MVQKIPEKLLTFGRALRNSPTVWESKLWKHLRGKNLGFRFKRQVRIGFYIVDFCCFEKKLVIELNGGYHKKAEYKEIDEAKLNFLENQGYRILKFWNREIDKDINKILEKIIKSLLTPPPTPPLVRGGEI